jgi:hypothetical protein
LRTIPLTTLRNMFALSSDEFPIILITISRGEDVIRLSSDSTQRISSDPIGYGTISRSNTFVYMPFELALPQDEAETVPKMVMRVQNVSGEIGWWLRSSLVTPKVTVEVVTSSDLDTVIASFPDFDLKSFQGGTMEVSGEIVLSNLEFEPFPAGTFNPSQFPGLF